MVALLQFYMLIVVVVASFVYAHQMQKRRALKPVVSDRPHHVSTDVCNINEEKWISCNHCRCLWAWATWSCTHNICSPQEVHGFRKECYHGDIKMVDCNKCVCQYGKWVCENQVCDAICTDGVTYENDCNTCMCIGGQYRCTEYPCITYLNATCLPGSKSMRNCNECGCNETGIVITCTDMDCY